MTTTLSADQVWVVRYESAAALGVDEADELAAETGAVLLASDFDNNGDGWALVLGTFAEAAAWAVRTGGRPPLSPKAGRYMDAGGAVVYVDDDARRVDSAEAVLESLGLTTEPAVTADEQLELVGRTKMSRMAWNFLDADRRERFGARGVLGAGMRSVVPGPVVVRRHGLHASRSALQALRYAPGPIVCRVELGGQIRSDAGLVAATERTVLWLSDAGRATHEFAVWCAEQALRGEAAQGRERADPSWSALETKRRWLRGEATDQEMAEAVDATRAISGGVVGQAARTAIRAGVEATGEAAWRGLWDCVTAALWAAACAGGRAASESSYGLALDAAAAAYNAELERRLLALAPD